MTQFQSTPLMRGETVGDVEHAHRVAISIHSPHTRGDLRYDPRNIKEDEFQSTPLTRGETVDHVQSRVYRRNFNPLPSHEGRRGMIWAKRSLETISIHSPHARGDWKGRHGRRCKSISIHSPHTRGDARPAGRPVLGAISIHSPLTRGDHLPHGEAGIPYNFNPLPSCEGRPVQRILDAFIIGISIHSPLTRGDASRSDRRACRRPISIHSPHTRGDCPSPCRPSRRTYFNPLPSREGRHLGIDIDKAVREFQSTPLMRGETHPTSFPLVGDVISIHSPHTRGDRASDRCTSFFYAFQSAPLM